MLVSNINLSIIAHLVCLSTILSSQSDSLLQIQKIDSIDFDGAVSERFWESIAPVPLVQYSPDAGSAPTEKTEIRFAYDDKYFYASMKAYDSNVSGIRGNSLYRDRLGGSDHFEILLDTYNDNESGLVFNTISTGVRTDGAISNDATGGTISSSSWFNGSFNTFWDTKVSRDEKGWYVETRIPFTSLRFQNIDGNVIMGLTVQRKIARKLERLVFPNVTPENSWAFLKPSLAQKILIKDIQPKKSVYISPFITTGLQRNRVYDSNNETFNWDADNKLDIGGDVKYSVTNNLTIDFTANTDFAQAEADDQLINLSRFSLFFPEKRQFFQERAGVFDFKTGGLSRLFFSRRIGIESNGSSVPILGGVRLISRTNTMDIGVLSMQTRDIRNIDSENFSVVRVKKRAFNEQSTLGGIFTSRIAPNGNRNFAYGIDGLLRVGTFDFLTMNISQTFDQQLDNTLLSNEDNVRFTLELNRRSRSGFGYNVGAIYSGSDYNPGVGFVDRSSFKFGTLNLSNTWLYPEGHKFIQQSIDFNNLVYLDNSSNELLTSETGISWSYTNRTQDRGSIGIKWINENLTQSLSFSPNASIPVGEYSFARMQASYSMAGEKIIRARVNFETGKFFDGWLHTLNISPSWFVSKHLELGLQYSYNKASFADRNEKINIHIARLRIGTALNTKLSTNAFIQYNSGIDLISANVRFRYNIKEGNDFWFVLNEGLNSRTTPLGLSALSVINESLLLKYIYTFVQ